MACTNAVEIHGKNHVGSVFGPLQISVKGVKKMLFEPVFFLAGGAVVLCAGLEKTAEYYGYYWLGNITKVALPLVGMILGVYFLENNPIIWWLK